MHYFNHRNQEWFVESVALNKIAEKFGTPCYVYSKKALIDNWYAFDKAFNNYPHQINYAVKANSNITILNILANLNFGLNSGFDVVSKGEIDRVLAAKCKPEKIIFSGVGKTLEELTYALKIGVGCINIESEAELIRLNSIAYALKIKAKVAFRINPNVDAQSHHYISTGLQENKFGINIQEATKLYLIANKLPGIDIKGVAFHIGSQITSINPFLQAIDIILELINNLKKLNIKIHHINVGGGLGVRYKNESLPTIQEYVKALINKLKATNLIINIEPGRSIVANAGVLLTRVEYIKKLQFINTNNKYNNKYNNKDNNFLEKHFAIVDAGMNDLLRPALYNAWHDIININYKYIDIGNIKDPRLKLYDIVGPICESSDFLAKDRYLAIDANDLLMICTAGAYGFSMSSNYNSRPKPAEVMVDGDKFELIRARESSQELFKLELI